MESGSRLSKDLRKSVRKLSPSAANFKRKATKMKSHIVPEESKGQDPSGVSSSLNTEEWSCVVVMLEEGSNDYSRLLYLLSNGIADGRRQHVACITFDQILLMVKQARPREKRAYPKRFPSTVSKNASKQSVNSEGVISPKEVESQKLEPSISKISSKDRVALAAKADQPTTARPKAQAKRRLTREATPDLGEQASPGDVENGGQGGRAGRPQAMSSAIEEALTVLRAGMPLPAFTVAKLVRGEVERIRHECLNSAHREMERQKRLHLVDFMSPKPILQTVFDGEKEHTKLRKRGAPARNSDAIEDQPEQGYDVYIVLIGFHMSQLPEELLRCGVPLRAIFMLISESDEDDAYEAADAAFADARTLLRSWPFVSQSARQAELKRRRDSAMAKELAYMQKIEAETLAAAAAAAASASPWGGQSFKGRSIANAQADGSQSSKSGMRPIRPQSAGSSISKFWPEMEILMWDNAHQDMLKDIAFHTLTFPDELIKGSEEDIIDYLYDSVSFASYDMFMTERVCKSYQENYKTIDVSMPKKLPRINEPGASTVYRTVMKSLPIEATDIPLRMRAMLQQVEYWMSEPGTMQDILNQNNLDPSNLSVVDVVKIELDEFFHSINKQYEEPSSDTEEQAPSDPLVVVQGDSVLMRAFHVLWPHGDVSTATVEVLSATPAARAWTWLPQPEGNEYFHFERFFAGLSERLCAAYGVRASCAEYLLEMVAFTRLPCTLGPCGEDEAAAAAQRASMFVRGSLTTGGTPQGESREGERTDTLTTTSTCPSSCSRSGDHACESELCSSFSSIMPGESLSKTPSQLKRERWAPSHCGDRRLVSLLAPPHLAELTSVGDLLRFMLSPNDSLSSYVLGSPAEDLADRDKQKGTYSIEKQKEEIDRDTIGEDGGGRKTTYTQLLEELAMEAPEPANSHCAIDAHRFARERSTNILLQQLYEAQGECQCFDVAYFRPTDVLLVRAHNPVDSNGLWHWRYDASLPGSKVALREFVDCVMDDIPEWVEQESARLIQLDESKARSTLAGLSSVSTTRSAVVTSAEDSRKSGQRLSTIEEDPLSGPTRNTFRNASQLENIWLLPGSLKYQIAMGDSSIRRGRSMVKGLRTSSTLGSFSGKRGTSGRESTATSPRGRTPSTASVSQRPSRNKQKRRSTADSIEREKRRGGRRIEDENDMGDVPSKGDSGGSGSASGAHVSSLTPLMENFHFGYNVSSHRTHMLGEKRRFLAADGSSVFVEVCDWLSRKKTMSVNVKMSGHTLNLHCDVRPPKHGDYSPSFNNRQPFVFHVLMSNGIVMAFSTRISCKRPPSSFPTPSSVQPHSPSHPGSGKSSKSSSKSGLAVDSATGRSQSLPPVQTSANTPNSNQTNSSPNMRSASRPQVEPISTNSFPKSAGKAANKEEDKFTYMMKMSWPSGLIVETVKRPKQQVYIRQSYLSKGPECEDVEFELWRCYAPDASIIKLMKNRRAIVMSPNGTVVLCTEFDPPLDSSWPRGSAMSPNSTSGAQTARSARGRNRPTIRRTGLSLGGVTEGKKVSNILLSSPTNASMYTRGKRGRRMAPDTSPATVSKDTPPPPDPLSMVEFETVQSDGRMYQVRVRRGSDGVKDEWEQFNSFLIRSYTDYESMETIIRRSDGTNMLFKPRGELITHFPDGSRISSVMANDVNNPTLQKGKENPPKKKPLSAAATTERGPQRYPQHVDKSRPEDDLNQEYERRTSYGENEVKAPKPHPIRGSPGNNKRQGPRSASEGKIAGDRSVFPLSRHLTDIILYPARQTHLKKAQSQKSVKGSAGSRTKLHGKKESGRELAQSKKQQDSSQHSLPSDNVDNDSKTQQDTDGQAQKSPNERTVINTSKDDPSVWEGIKEVHFAYTLQHPNYATVGFNSGTNVTSLEVPDAKMRVYQDGSYFVEMKGTRHDLGETIVNMHVMEHKIVLERRLMENRESLCYCEVDTFPFKCDVKEDHVMVRTMDCEGRSFDVHASGHSEYRRVGPNNNLAFSDAARYFLVHRDLTGLELCTAKTLRSLVRTTQEDPRGIYLSQVDSNQPDLSYHVSMLPLKSVSEIWLMPVEPVRLSMHSQRLYIKRLNALNKHPNFALRSTYGCPPNWFHPFPLSSAEKRKRRKQQEREEEDGEDSELEKNESSGGEEDAFSVPDPLFLDMLVEIVPYKMRLGRALVSALQAAVKEQAIEAKDDMTMRRPVVSFGPVQSKVEQRRRRTSERGLSDTSTHRPSWQEKTTSASALRLYNMAIRRRLAMTRSEEHLFQRKSRQSSSWQRGVAKALRAEVNDEIDRLRAILRSGRGQPYFHTDRGRAFLEEHKRRRSSGTVGMVRHRNMVEGAAERFRSGDLGQPTALAKQTRITCGDVPPTPKNTVSSFSSLWKEPPQQPTESCSESQLSWHSRSQNGDFLQRGEPADCRCGCGDPHECRRLPTVHSDISTYFPRSHYGY